MLSGVTHILFFCSLRYRFNSSIGALLRSGRVRTVYLFSLCVLSLLSSRLNASAFVCFSNYFPLIRHGAHRKLGVQQFFYFCVCIRCRRNVFTEPLPSNDRGIYQVCGWVWLRRHDIHTNFYKDWFRNPNVKGGRGYTDTQHEDCVSLLKKVD
jgi:hypothetical protein